MTTATHSSASTPRAPGSDVIAIAISLFFLACLAPAIDCNPYSEPVDGWDFETGWHLGLNLLLLGHYGGNNGIPWSANIFFIPALACLRFRMFRFAVLFGCLASILGLLTWWVRRYDTLLPGYYLWQLSLFTLAVGPAWMSYVSGKNVARNESSRQASGCPEQQQHQAA